MVNTARGGPSDDRNLLFGVLALQADLIDATRFAEACTAWSACKDRPLADLLMERGWLTPDDRGDVERLLDRKLKKHGGDAKAGLAEVSSVRIQQTLASIADPDLYQTIADAAATGDRLQRATILYQPTGRERYTLTRLHAKGGLGQVWLARDADLGREVALKELLGERAGDPSLTARFLEEAKITGQLEHPNIVPVYELARSEVDSAPPFYTMRFIRGNTLEGAIKNYHCKRLTKEAGPLELRELLGHFVAVCNAISYAHSRGVLHRDLKPSNIIVGDFGEVIVLDWGLAKLKGADEPARSLAPVAVGEEPSRRATEQGQVLGTPSYMPPEQAEGRLEMVDERSDVYALGAILYDLLTGEPPFDGPDTVTVLRRVVRDQPVAPRRTVPETSSALEAICLQALAKKPSDRYASAKSLAQDVQRWLGDEPVWAHREPLSVRAGRWVRRHRQLVTAAAALLLAAVPLSVIIAINREEARRQAEKAERETREQKDIAEKAEEEALAQKKIAQAKEQTAAAREAETRAVLQFVDNKVFAAARPKGLGGGVDKDITLRRAVEAAVPSVDQSFRDQPLIAARLLMTFGDSFRYMGDYAAAAEQFQKARTLYTQNRGPDDPDTLASMNKLANVYGDLGKRADALKLREETLALRKAKLGRDHPDTLQSMNNLAASYFGLGRTADAVKICEEVLAVRKEKLGADHQDTLNSLNNLAVSYRAAGRPEDALRIFEEALVLRKAKFGPDHLETALALNNLAFGYLDLDQTAKAAKALEAALAIRLSQLDPDHPDVLDSKEALSECYSNLGRNADALKLTEETLAGRKKKLGPVHLLTLRSMSNLAAAHATLGHKEEAVRLGEETLALQKANLGADDPETLRSMFNLADACAVLRGTADALKLYQETLALRKAKLRPGHPETLLSMWRTAESLAKLDRGSEALPILDECFKLSAGKHPDVRLIPGIINLRLRYFEKGKDAAGCKATAEMWESLNRTDLDSLYSAATFRAVTAAVLSANDKSADAIRRASDEADVAMAWLNKAVAAGFHDADRLLKDHDLDALHEREDFKKLLARLKSVGSTGGK
jgi:tetratricopeptide (TPR) repeat protein